MSPAPATVGVRAEHEFEIDRQIDGRADEGEHREEDRRGRLADDAVAKMPSGISGSGARRRCATSQHGEQKRGPGRAARRSSGDSPGSRRPAKRQRPASGATLAPMISAAPRHVEPMLAPDLRRGAQGSPRDAEWRKAPSGRLIQKISVHDRCWAKKPPSDGAGDARGRPDRRDVDDVFGALARRGDVGDDGLRERDEAAAAETLKRAADDQRRHARRQRAERSSR